MQFSLLLLQSKNFFLLEGTSKFVLNKVDSQTEDIFASKL